jgi:hypothetical protein
MGTNMLNPPTHQLYKTNNINPMCYFAPSVSQKHGTELDRRISLWRIAPCFFSVVHSSLPGCCCYFCCCSREKPFHPSGGLLHSCQELSPCCLLLLCVAGVSKAAEAAAAVSGPWPGAMPVAELPVRERLNDLVQVLVGGKYISKQFTRPCT